MGLWPGGFLDMRAETQFGEFINSDTGSMLATNMDGFCPLPDTHTTTLSHVVLTQFLSESMAVYFGKIETLDGDSNRFAGGRGKTQFMNQNFIINPVTLRSSPYSSMGAGLAFFFPNAAAENPSTLSLAVLGANGQPDTAGWEDDFEDGANYSAEFKLPTRFFGLDGAHLVGGTYNNKDFKSNDQNARRVLAAKLGLGTLAEDEGTWCAYYNFHQYLFTEAEDESQGWGIFGRYGFADDETSPIEDFYSIGVGGKGIFEKRDNDTFGVGYYYIGLFDKLPNLASNRFGDSQGFEVFYNIEVTPSLHITPDLQVINPSREQNQTAVVLGLRVGMTF